MSVAGTPPSEGLDASVPSFEQVFVEHSRYVWRLLRRLGVPPADVPDVTQEVFMILRRKLDHVASPALLRGFIYGIAIREASAFRRSARSRHETLAAVLPEQQSEPVQETTVARAEARALLEVALGKLEEDQRVVFVLYELEELAMREVAEAVGCPLQTAYSRLYAARRVVSEVFERAQRSAP